MYCILWPKRCIYPLATPYLDENLVMVDCFVLSGLSIGLLTADFWIRFGIVGSYRYGVINRSRFACWFCNCWVISLCVVALFRDWGGVFVTSLGVGIGMCPSVCLYMWHVTLWSLGVFAYTYYKFWIGLCSSLIVIIYFVVAGDACLWLYWAFVCADWFPIRDLYIIGLLKGAGLNVRKWIQWGRN